mmetsp:Transcript_3823/g.4312  ORF Transcript_3823/g.4312 Transcript_3823/m.4312 type:complete len:517 (-) Transcript_3823:534-2084(-)|eukprot:CAMPEP_0197845738 /NCGR_PEP_ID=MMETSP1438-20131217/2629_1 /TAXON_ID=1461541 /ORGANISM="Pterosperma sp., Strain CCMP1384" /LENGTH=516 /DNA_ID=CAMNT_0043457145 /DNA_START=121 /DNA_END=1671 /DNA_ORIENTATION=+
MSEPVEKTQKQLEREAAKKAKKAEEAAKKAAKAAAKEKQEADKGQITVQCVQNPPVGLEPCPGTRDFYPDEMRFRNWLFGHFKEVANITGFQEYDAPVLEHQELYKRKAGEEITAQMYAFLDKSDPPREVTLRPEMTPSLARMVLAAGQSNNLPLKWFSIPQCWRYENTTRGRKREHYQWNMDIIGCKGITAEVELLYTVTQFFKRIGVTSEHVGVKVNSRKVLGSVLEQFGVPAENFAPVCVVVDKLDKIGAAEVKKQLVEDLSVPGETADKILKCLECKTVDDLAALCGSSSAEINELKELFTLAEDYGFADYLIFDASVVRGLAYYTGVVFECFDRRGELRAICGGGRYDKLLSLYGAKTEVPACGFGFGDCVILELLKDLNLMPDISKRVDFVVAAYNPSMQGKAMAAAAKIRTGGATVDLLLEPKKKVAAAFEYADRAGADYMVFVAPDEWAKNVVRVKDLRAGSKDSSKQIDVPVDKLSEIKAFLASSDGGGSGVVWCPDGKGLGTHVSK